MHDQFERSFNLADLFCKAMGRPMFVSFLETDNTGKDVKNILTRWAGTVDLQSASPMYGPWKLFTLLAAGYSDGKVITTPVSHMEGGCPYPGGVRQKYLITSVSKYENAKIDAMFALLLLWSLEHEVRLHHVGFKYMNNKRLDAAIHEFTKTHTCDFAHIPAEDHDRYYFQVEAPTSPNKMYYMEYQSWPHNLPNDGIHVDVATSDPEGLLRFIQQYSGLEATFWNDGKNSPVGMVSGFEEDVQISVMAREIWVSPIDW